MKYLQALNILEENFVRIIGDKEKEYSFENRFDNFIQAAELFGETPAESLIGMCMKHFVSIIDLLNGRLNKSCLNEKVGDAFNYMLILLAMSRYSQDVSKQLNDVKTFMSNDILTKDLKFPVDIKNLINFYKSTIKSLIKDPMKPQRVLDVLLLLPYIYIVIVKMGD